MMFVLVGLKEHKKTRQTLLFKVDQRAASTCERLRLLFTATASLCHSWLVDHGLKKKTKITLWLQ